MDMIIPDITRSEAIMPELNRRKGENGSETVTEV